MNNASQDLARVQTESRISVNTWREWCVRLSMDPDDAVEVWDEVCAPMALVARALPGDKVNLVRLLGIVGDGKGSLDGFLAVALKAAIEKPFSSEIAAFVRSRKALAELDLAPAAVSDPQLDDDEEDEAVVSSGEAFCGCG
jgi:hypothetical protein